MGVHANVMPGITFAFACFLGGCHAFFANVYCGFTGQFFGDAFSGASAYYFIDVIAHRTFREVSDASVDCTAAQSGAFFSDDADYARYVICSIFLFLRFCFEDDACMGGDCAA